MAATRLTTDAARSTSPPIISTHFTVRTTPALLPTPPAASLQREREREKVTEYRASTCTLVGPVDCPDRRCSGVVDACDLAGWLWVALA
jgi:hypothetical protein